jgi:hypothetical protein
MALRPISPTKKAAMVARGGLEFLEETPDGGVRAAARTVPTRRNGRIHGL